MEFLSVILGTVGDRVHSLIVLLASGYVLAALLAQMSVGMSGFENVAEAFRFFQAGGIADWITVMYERLGAGQPKTWLILLLLVWALLSLVVFAHHHQAARTMLPSRPGAAVGFVGALCIDLSGQISAWAVLVVAIVAVAIGAVLQRRDWRFVEPALFALFDLVLVPAYIVLAPPLWLSQRSAQASAVGSASV